MKKTLVICLALLVLVSLTALAQDSGTTITINGGRTTVSMKVPDQIVNHPIRPASSPFYDNIDGGYNSNNGWTVCEGVAYCSERSQANQFISLKTGTTKKITVGLSFVEGTNSGIIDLEADCDNAPCGTPDGGKSLCKGTVKNMVQFGDSSTAVVSIACKVKLKRRKAYWVLIQSPTRTWLAWNWNATGAYGYGDEADDDSWQGAGGGWTTGALAVH